MDIELTYADQLSTTLSAMRRDLTEAGVKRVLIFALSRWGIDTASIYVTAIPTTYPNGKIDEVAPLPEPVKAIVNEAIRITNGASKHSTAQPIKQAECPICHNKLVNKRGLNLHMVIKHGTSHKAYLATLADYVNDAAERSGNAPVS